MKTVTKKLLGNDCTYETVSNLDEVVQIISDGGVAFVDSSDFTESQILKKCMSKGYKILIEENQATPSTDYHVRVRGTSVRAAIIENLESSERGEAVIPLTDSQVKPTSAYTMAYTVAKERGKRIRCENHWSHLKIYWQPSDEQPDLTPRQYIRQALEQLGTQSAFEIPATYIKSDKLNQMVNNEIAKSQCLLSRQQSQVLKYKAKVIMQRGNIYLCVDTKSNRVLELQRSETVKDLHPRDKEAVLEWMKSNIPNFDDFYFLTNEIFYREHKNPLPPMPRLG